MNRKLPAPLKAQIIKYGQNKGTDFKDPTLNSADKRMIATMDSIEGNLNHLSEALKTRFKALLVSQLSLLRYKDVDTNKTTPSSHANQGSLKASTNSEEQIYIKRCSLQTVHTTTSPKDVHGQSTAFDASGKKNALKLANLKILSQNEDRLPTVEYVSSISPRFKNPAFSTDNVPKSDIPQNLTRISPASVDRRRERNTHLNTRSPTITTSSARYRSPQSAVRTVTHTFFKRESTVGSEAADKKDFKGLSVVGGRRGQRPIEQSAVKPQQITASIRTKKHESKENVEPTKNLNHTASKKSPFSPSKPLIRGGASPKSPVRVSLSSQLKTETRNEAIKSSISDTHRNTKLRNRSRTNSISPKDSQPSENVESASSRVVSTTVDRRLSPTDDTLKGAYIELSQHSLNMDYTVPMSILNSEKAKDNSKSWHQTLHNQVKYCDTKEPKYVDNEDLIPNRNQSVETMDMSDIKLQVKDRGVNSKPSTQLGHKKCLGHHDQNANVSDVESKQKGHIRHKNIQEAHQDLSPPHIFRETDSRPREYLRQPNELDERLDLQLKKKLLLNAIRTLICVTHDAVERLMEEDFDLQIWSAIYKNVRGVEAELEEFSTTLTLDEILTPETAVKEAEGRLKTRLDVLFSLNNGRKRFQASEATRQDIMENVELLKSTTFKHGVSTQNEMLFTEMKHVVKEIKNLAEVFQVCGERFSKRLKDGAIQFHSLDRGNGISLFLKKCFLGGATGDQEEAVDDNNHCIRRSSSLDALADMCSDVFARMPDVQKALIILVFVGLVVYVVTECLSGACGTVRAVGDVWNNLYILRYGPPAV